MCTCTCNLCTSCLWLICTCTCTLYVQRTMYVHSIILCCTMYIVRCIYIMYNVQCKMHVQCTAMFNKCKVCVECGVRYSVVLCFGFWRCTCASFNLICTSWRIFGFPFLFIHQYCCCFLECNLFVFKTPACQGLNIVLKNFKIPTFIVARGLGDLSFVTCPLSSYRPFFRNMYILLCKYFFSYWKLNVF